MKINLQFDGRYDGGIARHVSGGLSARAGRLHHHDVLELNLVTQGAGVYLVDNRKYDVARNTSIWFVPNQEHFLMSETRDFEMWVVLFRARLLQRVCVTPQTRILLMPRTEGAFCRTLGEHPALRLRALFEEIFRYRNDCAYLNAGIAYGLMLAWMSQADDERVVIGSNVHAAVEKAARLLDQEPAIHSMDEIARHAGLSGSRLRKLFKKQTGVSIVAFRNEQRLRLFFQLYGRGQRLDMLEAALEAGFGSYPQFYRVFKQSMGHGPATYRKKLLEEGVNIHGEGDARDRSSKARSRQT